MVGLLSRGSAAGVVAVAIFFGLLRSGGISMQIAAHVPAARLVGRQVPPTALTIPFLGSR